MCTDTVLSPRPVLYSPKTQPLIRHQIKLFERQAWDRLPLASGSHTAAHVEHESSATFVTACRATLGSGKPVTGLRSHGGYNINKTKILFLMVTVALKHTVKSVFKLFGFICSFICKPPGSKRIDYTFFIHFKANEIQFKNDKLLWISDPVRPCFSAITS